EFARDMLASDGICGEPLWPYVNTAVTPVSGKTATDPSARATAAAQQGKVSASTHAKNPAGAAALLYQLLQSGRPVAICLPVFQDPATGVYNWTTNVGWAYGRVLNPPPGSVANAGHCVCVTGFVPDQNEPNGGYFIVRNSWDTAWGRLAPA